VTTKLKDLIEMQKREYLNAMEALKIKFTNEQHELLNRIHSNIVTSTPMNTSILTCTTDDEEFTEFKTCLQSQSHSLEEKTIVNDIDAKVRLLASLNLQLISNFQIKAATTINAHVRGYLTRRLMQTIYVQDNIRNIRETLQLVLNLNDREVGSPVQNILYKAKLFRQLQNDLTSFSEVFQGSTRERMKIIASDRELKKKKQQEYNEEQLSLSFKDVV
jgi:hypothetical protein